MVTIQTMIQRQGRWLMEQQLPKLGMEHLVCVCASSLNLSGLHFLTDFKLFEELLL